MKKVLFVGIGGFMGSSLRYVITGKIHDMMSKPWFPYGTLFVNIAGCFVLGLLNGIFEVKHIFGHEIRLMILVGVLGGFTTFSTFGYESLSLFREGQMMGMAINITLHILLGLSSAYFGYKLAFVF